MARLEALFAFLQNSPFYILPIFVNLGLEHSFVGGKSFLSNQWGSRIKYKRLVNEECGVLPFKVHGKNWVVNFTKNSKVCYYISLQLVVNFAANIYGSYMY